MWSKTPDSANPSRLHCEMYIPDKHPWLRSAADRADQNASSMTSLLQKNRFNVDNSNARISIRLALQSAASNRQNNDR